MNNFVENFGPSLIFDKDETPFEIPVMVAGSKRKNVKIKFIPVEIDIEDIKKALINYGTIETLKWEEPVRFNEDIYEVRRERLNADMILNKNIPSFITIKGIRLNVTYQGQPRTCSKCDDPSHEARNCGSKTSYASSVRKHLRNGAQKLGVEEQDVLSLAKAITDIANIEPNEDLMQLKRFKTSKNTNEWQPVKNGGTAFNLLRENPSYQEFPILQETVPNLLSKAKYSTKKPMPKNQKKPLSKDFNDTKRDENKGSNITLSKKSVNKAIKTLNKKKNDLPTEAIEKSKQNHQKVNNGTSGFPWESQLEKCQATQISDSLDNPEQGKKNPNNGTSGFPWQTQTITHPGTNTSDKTHLSIEASSEKVGEVNSFEKAFANTTDTQIDKYFNFDETLFSTNPDTT